MKTKSKELNRRDFIRITAAGAAAVGVASSMDALGDPAPAAAKMPTRPLGKTGFSTALFSLGGQGLLEIPGHQDEAVAIINRAIDLGVNYCDTSHYYGHGCSEEYYGTVMKTRRNEVFLATKSAQRGYDGAMKELEMSLTRLQTDHLDCWQLHNVRTQQDVDGIFADNGALKAFQKARDEKITRFIGITGHRNPYVLMDSIGRFDFDTILMAINAADPHLPGPGNESSFIQNLLPVAVQKGMGIIGMKVPALGKIFRPDGVTAMEQAMTYTLSHPVSTVIIGIKTIPELEENVRIAQNFKLLSALEMAQIEDLTKPYFADATFFKRQHGY